MRAAGDLFHCGTAAIGTGGSSGAGRWRKGRWVPGAASPRCSAGDFVHCLPLSRTRGSDFSAGHEGKSRLPKIQQDQELLKYSVSAQVMGENNLSCFNGCSDSRELTFFPITALK